MTGLPKTVAADARGDPLRDRRRRVVDRRVGDALPVEGAARTVAGLPRARHVPRRRRRPAARPRRTHRARDPGAGEDVERAARGGRARRRSRASSTTTRSRACSWAPAADSRHGRWRRSDARRTRQFERGLEAIRREFDVPGEFPAEVLAEAADVAGAAVRAGALRTSTARTSGSSRSIRSAAPTSTRRSPSSSRVTT